MGILMFFFVFLVFSAVVILIVNGYDDMKKNYPNYNGEDLFDDEKKKEHHIDEWDDNKQHTENIF